MIMIIIIILIMMMMINYCIENVLLENASVKAAVVLSGLRSDGRTIAFVVPGEGAIGGDALVAYVSSRLPAYMVPVEILLRDKVNDRASLIREYAAVHEGDLPSVAADQTPPSDFPHLHPLQVDFETPL